PTVANATGATEAASAGTAEAARTGEAAETAHAHTTEAAGAGEAAAGHALASHAGALAGRACRATLDGVNRLLRERGRDVLDLDHLNRAGRIFCLFIEELDQLLDVLVHRRGADEDQDVAALIDAERQCDGLVAAEGIHARTTPTGRHEAEAREAGHDRV